MHTMTRRSVLAILAVGGAAAGGVAAMLRYVVPARPEPGLRFSAAELPAEGAVSIMRGDTPVAIANAGDGAIVAFVPRCTHLGCTLIWKADGPVFEGNAAYFDCPCHSSRFAIDGRVLNGPAARDLDRYPSKLAGDGGIEVDPLGVIRGDPRPNRDDAPTAIP